MKQPKRILTREELHDLVWSTPMQKPAEIYGLSDRGSAKICERHLVPVPPRGYWAKLEAGQSVKRTPFRTVENTALHTAHIGSKVVTTQSAYLAEVLAAAKQEIEDENKVLRTRPAAPTNVPSPRKDICVPP